MGLVFSEGRGLGEIEVLLNPRVDLREIQKVDVTIGEQVVRAGAMTIRLQIKLDSTPGAGNAIGAGHRVLEPFRAMGVIRMGSPDAVGCFEGHERL